MKTPIALMIVALTIGGCDKPAEGCDRVAVASSFGVSSFVVAQPVIQTVAFAAPVVQTVTVTQPVFTSFAVAQPVFSTVAVSHPICISGGCNLGVQSLSLFGGRSVSRSRAVSVNRRGLFGRGIGRSRSVSMSRGCRF